MIGTKRVLKMRQLNRALLARQSLLERADLPLIEMVERMGGIQMQYAPSGYIGLWSRMADFERSALTKALEARDVIQGTLMRSTIHTVSARDYWPILAGIRASRREWFDRVTARDRGDFDVERAADAVRAILADGPLARKEIEVRLAERGFPRPALSWSHVAVDLVRVPPSGTWERRRADLYGLAEQWVPDLERPTEADGLSLLLRRYLGAFGPARVNDFADWAGISLARARAAVEATSIERFTDEQGRELIDLPGCSMPAEDTPAPVRFLPTWDAILLVHARRTLILPESHRPKIFNIKMPQSVGTFLVDGHVAGTWRHDAKSGQIVTQNLERLTSAAARAVKAEAHALAELHRG